MTMKITKITPYLVSAPAPFLPTAHDSGGEVHNREYLFVEVNTDAGITGWGEVTCTREQANRTVASMVHHVSDLLEGDDPKKSRRSGTRYFGISPTWVRVVRRLACFRVSTLRCGIFVARSWACRCMSCLAVRFVTLLMFTAILKTG